MQLTKTFPPNSAIVIEKKCVENRLWGKSAFLLGGKMYHLHLSCRAHYEIRFLGSQSPPVENSRIDIRRFQLEKLWNPFAILSSEQNFQMVLIPAVSFLVF